MKRILLITVVLLVIVNCFAARKALVIGNANYLSSPLRNPVNDANLIDKTLRNLGYSVTTIINADKRTMDETISKFSAGLMPADEALFYYSGHGTQVNGVNYLIPVGKEIFDSEDLQYDAYNGDRLIDKMQKAGLSIIILDACRDNPYKGMKSNEKGLAQMNGKAGCQYIIYATDKGATAADGNGDNSPFTNALVRQMTTSTKKIEDMMKDVAIEVRAATSDRQVPWTSGNLIQDFYFNLPTASQPDIKPDVVNKGTQTKPVIKEVETTYIEGNISLESNTAGVVFIDDIKVTDLKVGERKTYSLVIGEHKIALQYGGKTDTKNIIVNKDQTAKVEWNLPPVKGGGSVADEGLAGMVYVPGGTFTMGRTTGSGYSDELPTHNVTVSSFYIGKYEVTQKQWQDVMGNNPAQSYGIGTNYPVYYVSWYSVLKYCNLRSSKEGLSPVYSIGGSTNPTDWGSVPSFNNATWDAVICNWSANGYRLPTEAEWEFAARGGSSTPDYLYSGSNDINTVAWYDENSGSGSHPVGAKTANALGIYDMSGNVWEWCWDWYGSYSSGAVTNPHGITSGADRVRRGGSWSYTAAGCRVAFRSNYSPYGSSGSIGFRLCRAVP